MMAIEKHHSSQAIADQRRDQFLFLGPAATPTHPYGRLFPDVDHTHSPNSVDMKTWYINEPLKEEAKKWQEALYKVLDVGTFHEIRNMFKDERMKKRAYERYREAVAQRHRIRILDQKSSGIDYGITLQNTRGGERISMTKRELDALISRSLDSANEVVKYFEDSQTGILSPIRNEIPGHINEPPGWDNPIDLLLSIFSPKWNVQSRFESRRRLIFSDIAIEVHLHQRKILPKKEELLNIFGHHLFNPDKHGPSKEVEYITFHNPHFFAVDGVQILAKGYKYKPNPYILHHRLSLREWQDETGTHYTQIHDEPKGIAQYILKMIRNNTYDPSQIKDAYRMAATFLERREIEPFLEAIKKASHKAGKALEYDIEENTLDGGVYSALSEGKSRLYAGSSSKYQVMRVKLWYRNHPESPFELSCYTPESWANYSTRDDVNIAEYLIRRQSQHKKYDGSVLDYTHPYDIYKVNFEEHLDQIIAGIRVQVRAKAFVPNEWQTHRPINFDRDKVRNAVAKIAEQISPRNITPHKPKLPEIIIALGPNTTSAASALANHFSASYITYANDEDVKLFVKNQRKILLGRRILLLDDVGDTGRTIAKFHAELGKLGIRGVKTASLTVKEGSPVDIGNRIEFSGMKFKDHEYVFFHPEHMEDVNPFKGVFAIITRIYNGKLEILIQKEKDGEYKLTGGVNKMYADESLLEALRREIKEELGPEFMVMLTKSIQNVAPIRTAIARNSRLPVSPVNTLYLNGFLVDGIDIDIRSARIPKRSEVEELRWVTAEQALKLFKQPGFKQMLQLYMIEFKKSYIPFGPEYAQKYHSTIDNLYTQTKYQLVFQLLDKIPANSSILDIGSDIGSFHPKGLARKIKEAGFKYIGSDIDPAYFENGDIGTAVTSNSEYLPLRNNSVRAALALDVLDHVNNPQRALKEIRRVITSDGKTIIVVPALYKLDCLKEDPDFWFINNKRKSSHKNTFSVNRWLSSIKKAGFHTTYVSGFGYALSMPYLFWTEEQNVPYRRDYISSTKGITRDILTLLQTSLTPIDIMGIDSGLKTIITSGEKNIKQLVEQNYKLRKKNLWPLWSIPLMIRLHPDYRQRRDLQNLERKLVMAVNNNTRHYSSTGRRRLKKIGRMLMDPFFLLQSGGNSILIIASKDKQKPVYPTFSRKATIFESKSH